MNGLMIAATAFFLLFIVSSGWFLTMDSSTRDKTNARIRALNTAEDFAEASHPTAKRHIALIAFLGTVLSRSGILSQNSVADLQKTLSAAGINAGNALYVFVGAKAVAFFLGIASGLTIGLQAHLTAQRTMIATAVAAIMGLMLPDYIIRMRRKGYLKSLERGIPDMLDMLVICSEAGLNLEASMDRVRLEMIDTHPEISRELATTGHDFRIMSDRRQALMQFGARTGLPALIRLSSTLAQAVQYGTPLAQTFKTLAAELRQEMLSRFEERAGRLPVLLTIPMILFILPTVFMVLLGPAIISVRHAFH